MFPALERAIDDTTHRPCLAPDVEVARFESRWQGCHAVIHNPRTQTYVRLTDAEATFALSLDGTRTVRELAVAALEDNSADPGSVVDSVRFLHRGGFLTRPWIDAYGALAARLAPRRSRAVDTGWRLMRTMTITFGGVDGFVDRLYVAGGKAVFRPPVQVLLGVVVVAGVSAFAVLSMSATADLLGEPTPSTAATLFALGLLALFVHELGHALAVRHAGRRIVSAGFQLYLAHPAFFIDSSDMVMAAPRARAVNAAAGPIAQATVASTAALLAAAVGPGEIRELLFRFAGMAYVFTALNLIPFLELDGYWLVTDVLDVPDLRPRALAFVRHELPDRLRRRIGLRRAEWGLVLFGVLGALFTVIALATAWVFWWPLLRSFGAGLWRAGVVGQVALLLLGALVVGPLVHGLGDARRAMTRWVVDRTATLQFRLEQRWRVEAAELVAALPHADDLRDDVLGDVAGRVRRHRCSPGEVIVRQGEAPDAFYVVRRGVLTVVEATRDGRESTLATLGPGDSFGELSLLEGSPRTATVRAVSSCDVMSLDAGAFQRLLAGSLAPPDVAPSEWPVTEVWSLTPFRDLDLRAATELAYWGTWRHAAPGDDVVCQGEVGHTFYVVGSGQLDTLVDGHVVRTLVRGDFFGELALLHDAPRSATVTARTPCRLFALDRRGFDALLRSAFEHAVAPHVPAETHSAGRTAAP